MKELKPDANDEHEHYRTGERRKKTTFDWISVGSGTGSVAIGALVLQIVFNNSYTLDRQGETLDKYGGLIVENKHSQREMTQLLQEMRQKFSIDVAEFHVKHDSIKSELVSCENRQFELNRRITDLERNALERGDYGEFYRLLIDRIKVIENHIDVVEEDD